MSRAIISAKTELNKKKHQDDAEPGLAWSFPFLRREITLAQYEHDTHHPSCDQRCSHPIYPPIKPRGPQIGIAVAVYRSVSDA